MNKEDSLYTQGGRQEPPRSQGLYDPAYEHEACGVGFVVDVAGKKSHRIVRDGIREIGRAHV